MNSTVVLEWWYSPLDCFERPFEIVVDEARLLIGDGKVQAWLATSVYDRDPSVRAQLQQKVECLLKSAQSPDRKGPSWSPKPTVNRTDADGRRHVTIEPGTGKLHILGYAPDVRICDPSGKIIRDSRGERIEREEDFARRVVRHADNPWVPRLMESLHNARSDSPNVLVHLYEIRDALKTIFRSECKAQAELHIKDEWQYLGGLANNPRLNQGRHRGRSHTQLEATESELGEAFRNARRMIEAYLEHLEKLSSKGP